MANEIGIYAAVRMRYYCDNDWSMGYSQPNRMSERESDCSQLYLRCINEALRHYGLAGIDTTGYTGNMCRICAERGAEIYQFDGNIYDLSAGDGIVNEGAHVEMALNASEWGGANQDENGEAGYEGTQAGDQTGREVYVKAPYNYNWGKVISWVNFDIGGAEPVQGGTDSGEYHVYLQAKSGHGVWSKVQDGAEAGDDTTDNPITPLRFLSVWSSLGTIRGNVWSDKEKGWLDELSNPSDINNEDTGSLGDGSDLFGIQLYLDAPDCAHSIFYQASTDGGSTWSAVHEDDRQGAIRTDKPITTVKAWIDASTY